MKLKRLRPDVKYRRTSPNRHSRSGRKPVAIVVHSTEGRNIPNSARDLRGCADYLCQPRVKASCHVITDSDGHSARIVSDGYAAWTCAYYNSITLNIEQIGIAAEGGWTDNHYKETARWIARWSKMYGIPIQKGRVSNGTVVRKGVLRHSDLGSLGGGHSDPGRRFDLDRCLDIARVIRRKL